MKIQEFAKHLDEPREIGKKKKRLSSSEMKKVKDESKLVGIIYFCDTLGKEIITKDIDGFSASSQDCDLCGTHGTITFYVNCECGKYHNIEINSW